MDPESAVPWLSILFSLTLRFVAVFVVLGILMIGLYVSGAITTRLVARGARLPPGQ